MVWTKAKIVPRDRRYYGLKLMRVSNGLDIVEKKEGGIAS